MHSSNHSLPEAQRVCLQLADEVKTTELGAALASVLQVGQVVWLEGELGAGKTTLVRALVRALGHQGAVKSPTYTLVELYAVSSLYLYHFDFYRFNEPEEFDDAGLGEYFRSDSLCLVEWPAKAAGFVPPADLAVIFRFAGDSPEAGRIVELQARSAAGKHCLSAFMTQQSNRFHVVES